MANSPRPRRQRALHTRQRPNLTRRHTSWTKNDMAKPDPTLQPMAANPSQCSNRRHAFRHIIGCTCMLLTSLTNTSPGLKPAEKAVLTYMVSVYILRHSMQMSYRTDAHLQSPSMNLRHKKTLTYIQRRGTVSAVPAGIFRPLPVRRGLKPIHVSSCEAGRILSTLNTRHN
eukprot:352800-Chlamydomonas_euryale.AAC.15